MKKYFLSFASSNYIKTLQRLEKEAKRSGFFDEVILYTENDIPEFIQEHSDFIKSNPRGYGYWIWKPYCILKILNQIEEGDILVYLDAGSTINVKGKERFNEYINMCINSEFKNVCFQYNHYTEIQYTKKEIFEFLNVPEEHQKSGQIMANTFILQKCNFTTQLIEKWYNTCCNYNLVNDYISKSQHPEFIENRHDQSIFSCLYKIFGCHLIPNECDLDGNITIYREYMTKLGHCPFWATRRKF